MFSIPSYPHSALHVFPPLSTLYSLLSPLHSFLFVPKRIPRLPESQFPIALPWPYPSSFTAYILPIFSPNLKKCLTQNLFVSIFFIFLCVTLISLHHTPALAGGARGVTEAQRKPLNHILRFSLCLSDSVVKIVLPFLSIHLLFSLICANRRNHVRFKNLY